MLTLLESSSTSRSHFSPAFLQALQSPSSTLSVTEHSVGISYSPERHGTITAFEGHVEFTEFKNQFKQQLAFLIAFAERHHGNAERVGFAFNQLADRLFDPANDFYDKQTTALFGAGKRALDELVELIKDEALPLPNKLEQVIQLADGVQKCADGAATNLALAAAGLKLQGGDEMYSLKQDVAQQLILEYLGETIFKNGNRNYFIGMEIHYVNAIKNALADELGFAVQEDQFANLKEITPAHIKECLRYVLKHMTPARLAIVAADNCLSQFNSMMQPYFADPAKGNTAASFDYASLRTALESAVAPLKEKYGALDPFSFISPVDDEYERMGINRDPTPLALEILKSQRENGLLACAYQSENLIRYHEGSIKIGIEHHDAQLIWATEDDRPVLLKTAHLQNVSPFDLKDVLGLAIGTAITNSSPHELLENLTWGWLSVADLTQLISKTSGATCSPLLQKYQNAINTLPRSVRQGYAIAIATCGTPVELTAYMTDHIDLISPVLGAEEILLSFWPIANNRKDVLMLDAVTNLAVEAIGPATILSPDFFENIRNALGNYLTTGDEKFQEFNATALFSLGKFSIKAWENKLLSSKGLNIIFAAVDTNSLPGFTLAMANGSSRQVSAFGDVILLAAAKGALNPRQIGGLLSGLDSNYSALYFALQNNYVTTIAAFGKCVLSAYERCILDAKQVYALLACAEDDGAGQLLSALANVNESTKRAFGELLLAVDIVSQSKSVEGDFLLLAPELYDWDYKFKTFNEAQALTNLHQLTLEVMSTHAAAKSGELSGSELEEKMDRLQMHVHEHRIALFVMPRDLVPARKNIAGLYSDVIPKWHALKNYCRDIRAND